MHIGGAMDETIEEIFHRIAGGNDDVDRIRLDIANLIARRMDAVRESFGAWERLHFAQAIAALADNIAKGDRDSTAWLRLSLVALEKAGVPTAERSDQYPIRNDQVEALTFEALSKAIRKLGGYAG